MKSHKRGRTRRPSAPPIFDEGVAPLKSRSSFSNPPADRKTLQLCARVAEVLNLSLSGDGQDDLLIGWAVDRVVRVQGASLLMVLVTPIDPRDRTAPSTVLSRLTLAKPRLRSEIARAIQRRKTPDLVFQVVKPGDEVTE